MIKKFIIPILGVGSILTGYLLLPLAGALVKRMATTEVLVVTPHSPEAVTVNLDMWNFDAPDPKTTPDYDKKLIEVYGIRHQVEPLLFVKSKLVYPDKAKRPDLFFLPVDKQKGENPWQVKTIDFLVDKLSRASILVAAAFFSLFLLLKLASPARPGRSPASDVAAH